MGDAVSHAAGLKVASVVENKFTSALLHGLKAAVCHRLVRDCFREGNLYKGEELKDYFFPHFCGFPWMFTVASHLSLSKNVRLVHTFEFGKCFFWPQWDALCTGGVAGMALCCGLRLTGEIGCPLKLRKCSESGRR